jgi:coenzyme F420-reducing hydrogenase alpha subunit
MELLAGRKTHPVSFRVGGFGKLPTKAELQALKNDIEAIIPDVKAVAEVVLSLAGKLPKFERNTEYVALAKDGLYPLYDGDIGSTDTDERVPVQQFERVVNEYVHPQSTAKWCKYNRDTYMVGALARFNVNAPELLPMAKATAKMFGLEQGCSNPYMNNIAQVVELVQAIEHSLQLLDELLTVGVKQERLHTHAKAGEGAGAVEAPRGILFHRYEFDKHGRCLKGNCCIPTNQNHANIQKDFEALVPQILDREQDEIRLLMEMLVRAYDPCISCSTHFLNVEFV